MIKRNSNILVFIFIIISIFVILTHLDYIIFDEKTKYYIDLVFMFIAVFVAFILKLFIQDVINLKEEQKIKFQKEKSSEKYVTKEEVKVQSVDKSEEISSHFIKTIEVADDIVKFTENVLKNFAKNFDVVQGIFFIWNEKEQYFYTANTFAFYSSDFDKKFKIGEGITGQVAKNKKILLIDNVPENYVNIVSGLGEGSPKYLIFVPIISDDKVIGVFELASFVNFPSPTEKIFTLIANKLAELLHNYISFENK